MEDRGGAVVVAPGEEAGEGVGGAGGDEIGDVEGDEEGGDAVVVGAAAGDFDGDFDGDLTEVGGDAFGEAAGDEVGDCAVDEIASRARTVAKIKVLEAIVVAERERSKIRLERERGFRVRWGDLERKGEGEYIEASSVTAQLGFQRL